MIFSTACSRRFRDIGIQICEGSSQVARENHVPFTGAPQGSVSPERLGVEHVDAVPLQRISKVVRERLLDQPILAVDVSNHAGATGPGRMSSRSDLAADKAW